VPAHSKERNFFKGCGKEIRGAEMMPLTCAPLGHWALAIGIWEPRGGGEPDDWLPVAAACESSGGHWRAYRGGWTTGVVDMGCKADWQRLPFLWTHPFDPGRLAMMLAWPSCQTAFFVSGVCSSLQGRFPVLGLAAGSGSPEGDLAADMCRRLTSCPCFTYNSPKNMT